MRTSKAATKGSSGSGKSSKGGSSKSNGKKNIKTGQEWQHLSVVVFRGDPYDASDYRHTGLFIEHLNEDGTQMHHNFLHVTGTAGSFVRAESTDRDPKGSGLFEGSVPVATIPATDSSDRRLRHAIWSTSVNNTESSWNCHHWVGDALNACVGAGLISTEESYAAIDGMTDLILAAPYVRSIGAVQKSD